MNETMENDLEMSQIDPNNLFVYWQQLLEILCLVSLTYPPTRPLDSKPASPPARQLATPFGSCCLDL